MNHIAVRSNCNCDFETQWIVSTTLGGVILCIHPFSVCQHDNAKI